MSAYCAPRGPDFLAVDDELVADDFRARLQRRQVGACAGFGVALAPDFFGVQNFRQVALLLFLAAPRDERRPEHPEARRADVVGRPGADHFVVDDRLPHGVHRLAAVFFRPCERDVAGLVQATLPRLRSRQPGLVVAALARVGEAAGRHVFLEPVADLEPKRFFFGRELKIHVGNAPAVVIALNAYRGFAPSIVKTASWRKARIADS